MADMSRNISDTLKGINVKTPNLSTLAKKGDDTCVGLFSFSVSDKPKNLQRHRSYKLLGNLLLLVQRFLSENIYIGKEEKDNAQSQLYIASFWGFSDVVKTLVENGTDVNAKNPNTLWTPLHAAAFQEHGKIVMFLLQQNADPWAEDFGRRTPVDFGSASDKLWPLFAVCGCTRTPKKDLIQKGVLKQPNSESGNISTNTSGDRDINSIREMSDMKLINYDNRSSNFDKTNERSVHAASVDGDVLAGDNRTEKSREDRPNFNAWRT